MLLVNSHSEVERALTASEAKLKKTDPSLWYILGKINEECTGELWNNKMPRSSVVDQKHSLTKVGQIKRNLYEISEFGIYDKGASSPGLT